MNYDFNIWSRTDNELCITAYEWHNMTEYYTVRFQYPRDLVEIEFLLNDLAVNHYPFTDYDTWESEGFLTRSKISDRVSKWLDTLPEYEMKESA